VAIKVPAISLVSADEFRLLRDIEKLLNQKLERIEIDGFEPEHVVPTKEKAPRRKFNNKAGFRKRKRTRKG
jgi:ATP-dependent RNA helicase RhlE